MKICIKCKKEISDEQNYITLEKERSIRSGEAIFCKDCGEVFERSYDIIKKHKKIINEYWKIAEEIWMKNLKRL